MRHCAIYKNESIIDEVEPSSIACHEVDFELSIQSLIN